MKHINRFLTNICTDDLVASKQFYTTLFELNTEFDSDWFVHLTSKDKKVELGLIDRQSQFIPQEYQNLPSGCYLTFVVDNVDELFEIAKAKEFKVIEEPQDTSYGQRRLMLKDPNGMLIDVSSLI